MRLELVDVSRLFSAFEFQFHKGAIRTAYAAQKYKEIQYFNSIKVRLEPNLMMNGSAGSVSFQFHKGAIRTSWSGEQYTYSVISIP